MKLIEWIAREGLNYTSAAEQIEVESPETVRRYCLPSSDPLFRIPRPAVMRRIMAVSGGLVTANDFYDAPPAAAAPAEAAA
jgi:hypothetical protein